MEYVIRPILIPEYYNDFKCIGADCEDTCCAGWTVSVDKKSFQNYKQVKQPEMKERLRKNVKRNRQATDDSFYAKIALDDESRCTMLTSEGLCSIQLTLGEEYLCNTCAIYPRYLSKVGTVIEKSLTLSCPEAARLILLREEGLGFIEAVEPKNTRGFINGELDMDGNAYFWDLRVFAIQLLQSRQQPIEIRLIILGLFLQKLEQIDKSNWSEMLPSMMEDYLMRLDNNEFISSLQNIEGNLEFQITLIRQLLQYRLSDGGTTQKYLGLLQEILGGLAIDEIEEKGFEKHINIAVEKYRKSVEKLYEPFMQKHEYMLENYVVNYVFKNLFPSNHKTLFESYLMLALHYSLMKLHIIGVAAKRDSLTKEIVVECVQQFSKAIEHHQGFLQGVREGMKEMNLNTMGHMFAIIKN